MYRVISTKPMDNYGCWNLIEEISGRKIYRKEIRRIMGIEGTEFVSMFISKHNHTRVKYELDKKTGYLVQDFGNFLY